jgi:hypothetical protein
MPAVPRGPRTPFCKWDQELYDQGGELALQEISRKVGVPAILTNFSQVSQNSVDKTIEIAPELTGHSLPFSKCEAYNRVYDQPYESR